MTHSNWEEMCVMERDDEFQFITADKIQLNFIHTERFFGLKVQTNPHKYNLLTYLINI